MKGVKAVNPVNNKEVLVFVGDYVLLEYGTGAIMAVPAHDQRDFAFSKSYNLPITEVIKPEEGEALQGSAMEEDGILVNSGQFTGLTSQKAREKITDWLKKQKKGKKDSLL